MVMAIAEHRWMGVCALVLNQILFGACNWLSYPASRRRLPDALVLKGEAHASQTLQSDLNR